MKNKADVDILPEDRVNLNQEQKNLIELALQKQVPPEDAELIEKVQEESKTSLDPGSLFIKLSDYFTRKYGIDFGIIYLSAIIGGEEKYKETIESIERLRALDRAKRN